MIASPRIEHSYPLVPEFPKLSNKICLIDRASNEDYITIDTMTRKLPILLHIIRKDFLFGMQMMIPDKTREWRSPKKQI